VVLHERDLEHGLARRTGAQQRVRHVVHGLGGSGVNSYRCQGNLSHSVKSHRTSVTNLIIAHKSHKVNLLVV